MQDESALPSPTLPMVDAVEPTATAPRPRLSWPSLLLIVGTVVLTVALFFVPRDSIDRLGAYGYLGVFVLTMLASASIVLPSPAVAIALAAGRTLNPWLVGLSAGVAAGLGEITGYMAGRGGSGLVASNRYYPRIERWVQRWGVLTIFVMAIIPSPLFDFAGIAAGAMKMPFHRFLVACTLGKLLRFIIVAWLGHYSTLVV